MKPAKPSVDFPLFPHSSGKWAKKIKVDGKVVFKYFGKWEDASGALREYRQFMSRSATVPVVSLADGIDAFLAHKEAQLKQGELGEVQFKKLERTCRMLADRLGNVDLSSLTPQDFADYKAWRAQSCNIQVVTNEVTRVRGLFKWLYDPARLIPEAMNFGSGFSRAPAKALRKHRREQGKKLFKPDEILRIIDEAGVQLQAMLWLSINCAFGPTDLAQLPVSAVDGQWIDFPRPKTEIERTAFLWPETVEALERWNRRRGARWGVTENVFLTNSGEVWNKHEGAISKKFNAARIAAGVPRGTLYFLRHTFETIAGGSKDQIAVSHVMGHNDSSMSGIYREEIDRQRIIDACLFVRKWLLEGSVSCPAREPSPAS